MNDIIIIGGGISGLYCFYELEKKYKNLKISLFEKNNYFGGRFLTKTQKIFDKSLLNDIAIYNPNPIINGALTIILNNI